ncbi:hypothetical protein SCHPADRAFT_898773 [Schizopora paradoxa]|uniref:Uncharacterized protein n=1 Tax=Schizopora paradoxa TaxID=27342 RepID=A0A0H2SR02_9AGAM|nr:hypothetical protein SCHPADRAFT_898773 [Schizopora paradoxa]
MALGIKKRSVFRNRCIYHLLYILSRRRIALDGILIKVSQLSVDSPASVWCTHIHTDPRVIHLHRGHLHDPKIFDRGESILSKQ